MSNDIFDTIDLSISVFSSFVCRSLLSIIQLLDVIIKACFEKKQFKLESLIFGYKQFNLIKKLCLKSFIENILILKLKLKGFEHSYESWFHEYIAKYLIF